MFRLLRWPLTRIFYSLRWRLTGWYVLLLTAVLLLFSAGTYIAVYKLLLDNFDDLLTSQEIVEVVKQQLVDSDIGAGAEQQQHGSQQQHIPAGQPPAQRVED